MNSITVDSSEMLSKYKNKGYSSDIESISMLLGVGITKARTLVKNAPKIKLNEKLFYEMREKELFTVSRYYYSDDEVMKYLIENELITVSYHDPQKAFFKNGVDKETVIDKKYLLKHISSVTALLGISKNVSDIIINEYGYEVFPVVLNSGEKVEWYVKEDECDLVDNWIVKKEEIYTKNDYVRYTNMIKRGFYLKFQIGKGNNKYIHTVKEMRESNETAFITYWADRLSQ